MPREGNFGSIVLLKMRGGVVLRGIAKMSGWRFFEGVRLIIALFRRLGRIAAQMDKESISAIELTELMQDLAKGKEVLARKGGTIDDISLEETNETPLSQTDGRSPT